MQEKSSANGTSGKGRKDQVWIELNSRNSWPVTVCMWVTYREQQGPKSEWIKAASVTLQREEHLGLLYQGMGRLCPAKWHWAQLPRAQRLNSYSLANSSSPRDCPPASCPEQGWGVGKGAPGQLSSALALPSCCGWVMYRAGKEKNANTWQSKWLSQKRKHWARAAVGVQHGVSPVCDGQRSARSFVRLFATARGLTNASWLAKAACQGWAKYLISS